MSENQSGFPNQRLILRIMFTVFLNYLIYLIFVDYVSLFGFEFVLCKVCVSTVDCCNCP